MDVAASIGHQGRAALASHFLGGSVPQRCLAAGPPKRARVLAALAGPAFRLAGTSGSRRGEQQQPQAVQPLGRPVPGPHTHSASGTARPNAWPSGRPSGRSSPGVCQALCQATVVGVNPDEVFATADGEECEVVSGQEVVLGEGPPGAPATPPKADDPKRFWAYLVQPLKNSNGTGVLLLPDVMGQDSKENREWAHRIACFGYSVLVPDLHRGQAWDPSKPQDEYEHWRAMHAGPAHRVAEDIDTATAYLRSHLLQVHEQLQEQTREARECTGTVCTEYVPTLALVGFCFGGGRVFEALARDAAAEASKFSTGVVFYGTRFDPEAAARDVKVPVLLIAGDQDPLCPVESLTAVGDAVGGSEVIVFPGRGHAFAHRPGSMEEDDDAESAFQAARHWLHRHLLPDVPQPEGLN